MDPYPYASAPYGMPQFSEKKEERRKIRLLGFYAGSAILLYVFIQNVIVGLMMLFGLYTQYRSDPLLQDGADILIIVVSLLLPFLLLSRAMRGVSGLQSSLPLDFPQKGSRALLAVPAGVAVCLLSNNVTSYFISFLGGFGLKLTSPEVPLPQGVLGIVVAVLRVAVVATLVEELCFRGVLMQNLRPFGNGFAVFIAAALFGMLHGNLVQAPFAFLVGLILGWFTIATGTIWTSILIHACNNLISLAISYLSGVLDETRLGTLYLFLTSFLILLGLICFALFLALRDRKATAQGVRTLNGFWAKAGAFITNPTMILALIYLVYAASQFVKATG